MAAARDRRMTGRSDRATAAPSGGALAPAAGDAELGEGRADRLERAAHLRLAERADAADPERVGDGELARVEDVALVADAIVEPGEVEARVGRHVHRDDDRRLEPLGEQRLEAERAQALHEDAAVAPVARAAPGDAALRLVRLERGAEGGDDMGRRGEAPLPVPLHRLPLVEEVEGEAVAAPGAF